MSGTSDNSFLLLDFGGRFYSLSFNILNSCSFLRFIDLPPLCIDLHIIIIRVKGFRVHN